VKWRSIKMNGDSTATVQSGSLSASSPWIVRTWAVSWLNKHDMPKHSDAVACV
jgi:hypothetical protein